MTSKTDELPTLIAVLDDLDRSDAATELLYLAAAGIGGTETEALRIGVAAAQQHIEAARAKIRAIQGGAA